MADDFTVLFTILITLVATDRPPSTPHPVGRVPTNIKGVAAALRTFEAPRPDLENSVEGHVSFQRCHVYLDLIVLEVDTGQKGAASIAIRKRERSQTLAALCQTAPLRGEIQIVTEDEYFLGKAGDSLFTISADNFGAEGVLGIYDAQTGERRRMVSYNVLRPVLAKWKENTLSLDYDHRLLSTCSLARSSTECWRKIRADNGIETSVAITPPRCGPVFAGTVFRESPELLDIPNAVQLFAHARIENMRTEKITYLGGETLCYISP